MTVSELNSEVKAAIERSFSSVWVEGEVVGFSRPSSGHWYFTLNDGSSQLKCVCWKTTNFRIRFRPENGITVRVRGRLSVYEPRGEYQLVVDSLEPSGEGALRAAFEQIRSRLEREGLFNDDLKRPIPFLPRRVGIVTSRSGAAFHDVVTVLTRRARSVRIVLAAAHVQGEGAADTIRRAIKYLNEYSSRQAAHERLDVLILGRGGGSAEDLWAFNDEALARAIRSSEIPIISAVGHEIDWTISDLIADLRAATPSAAAELVAAREQDVLDTFCAGENRLAALIERQLDDLGGSLDSACHGLEYATQQHVSTARERFLGTAARLSPQRLTAKAVGLANKVDTFDARSRTALQNLSFRSAEALNVQMAKLNTLSPLAVLTRGYSITHAPDGTVLRDASQAKTGDKLKIQLENGKLDAEVLPAE